MSTTESSFVLDVPAEGLGVVTPPSAPPIPPSEVPETPEVPEIAPEATPEPEAPEAPAAPEEPEAPAAPEADDEVEYVTASDYDALMEKYNALTANTPEEEEPDAEPEVKLRAEEPTASTVVTPMDIYDDTLVNLGFEPDDESRRGILAKQFARVADIAANQAITSIYTTMNDRVDKRVIALVQSITLAQQLGQRNAAMLAPENFQATIKATQEALAEGGKGAPTEAIIADAERRYAAATATVQRIRLRGNSIPQAQKPSAIGPGTTPSIRSGGRDAGQKAPARVGFNPKASALFPD